MHSPTEIIAQSYQRRWSRFLSNLKISPLALYLLLALAALAEQREKPQCLCLALDTSLLWNRYCLISLWHWCSPVQFQKSLIP